MRNHALLSPAFAIVALLSAAPACQKNDQPAHAPSGTTGQAIRAPHDEPAYEVTFAVDGAPVAGAEAQAVARLTARPGYHVNPDYPLSFQPDPADGGARFAHGRYALKESVEKTACAEAASDTCAVRAKVPFVAGSAGQHVVSGIFAFSVCSPERCLIEKVPVSATFSAR